MIKKIYVLYVFLWIYQRSPHDTALRWGYVNEGFEVCSFSPPTSEMNVKATGWR